MRSILTMLALTLAATATAAAAPPPGSEAATILHQVLESPAARSYPEEFASFVTTIATAEEVLLAGDRSTADRLYTLAVVKGGILLERTRETAPLPATPPPLLFRPLSSAGQNPLPLPLPAPQLEPTPVSPPEEPLAEEAEDYRPLSARIVGNKGVYVVKRRESLRLVASRLGVSLRNLARMNQLKTGATVEAGQRLHYNNRRIAPKKLRNGIIINIPDRNLYLFRNGMVIANYPVALGLAKRKNNKLWQTPTGRFRIIEKAENPIWRIPLSIQKEMEEKGEEVLEKVPPGPKNPLGKYAMRTTLGGILIHSTTSPTSINSYSSHGCIRVMPEHMERLFKAVTIPMDGEIIYQPVKVEVTTEGKVFLEVNSDFYETKIDLAAEADRLLKKLRAESMVSWEKVDRVVKEKSGIAEDVTLETTPD